MADIQNSENHSEQQSTGVDETRISKQLAVGDLTVELEAIVSGKQFGGDNSSWDAAGYQLKPSAVVIHRENGQERLDLNSVANTACGGMLAGFVAAPLVSFLLMALTRRINRRKRRSH